MKLYQLLQKLEVITIPEPPLPVEKTVASEVRMEFAQIVEIKTGAVPPVKNSLQLAVHQSGHIEDKSVQTSAPAGSNWAFTKFDAQMGSGILIASHPAVLFACTCKLLEEWTDEPVRTFENGKYLTTAFKWHRPLYDYLLTQVWRTARGFDPEQHIREMARAGYTHMEVNGLAMPVPFEDPVPGEFYSQFYSYCAALDQFVCSELNRGIYPAEYLAANLHLLKKYAELGRKYGLEPGILCFEPRSVPERLLERFPTLRGARVDHPYRSRKPRYTLSTAHPRVQAHYAEMMQNLMREAPDLAYMSVWSNDSGAGFEYTNSLYVGRNGGPYLIREWRTHEQIAEAAGRNIVDFLRLLQRAAAEINPDFRVSLRLEPFQAEQDFILENLDDGLDIEAPSMLVQGYDLPYCHEKYPDIQGIAGTVLHTKLVADERERLAGHRQRSVVPHLVYSQGNGFNFEPLFGIPFPRLLWQKLAAMRQAGVQHAANLGGHTYSGFAPYHVNQELFRAFMLDPNNSYENAVGMIARKWVGAQDSESLIDLWHQVDEAIRWLPPLPLYSGFGFVWLRIWVRPIVPNLLAIPAAERRYYENFMVSARNNTNHTDLAKDVLFELITPAYGQSYIERVDEHVAPRLQQTIEGAARAAERAGGEATHIFADLHSRLRALRCWVGTLRSVSAWVVGVHGYLHAANQSRKSDSISLLNDMTRREIENTQELLDLWIHAKIQFMVISEAGETSYIYGENFGELLQKKIDLMQRYRTVEPAIDHEIMWQL